MKRKIKKRLFALTLCLLSVCSLCACGDASGSTAVNSTGENAEIPRSIEHADSTTGSLEKVSFSTEDVLAGETEYSYTYVEYTMPESVRIEEVVPGTGTNLYVIAIACDVDGYFITGEDGVMDMRVIGYDVSDGGSVGFQYTPDYTGYDDYYINAAATAPDGSLWMLVVFLKFENDTMEQIPQYIHLDATGTVLDTVSAPIESVDSTGFMQVDSQGNLYYLSDSTGLVLCDETGTLLMQAELELSTRMTRTNDGTVWVLTDTETGTGLSKVNSETSQLEDVVEIQGVTNGYPTLCGGWGTEGTVLASNSTSIYEIDLETGAATELVDLEQYGASGAGEISRLSNGTFIFLLNETKAFYVSGLQLTSTGTAVTKTVLSLATVSPDSPIMELVNNFNRSSENYYVEVFDFSEYLDSGSYSDLYSAWNVAFASGEIPDMIDFYNLPWHSYADKGFLLDLNTQLDTENILPWLWDAVAYNGANYTFPSCFTVETLYGKSAALGGLTSWTLEDFFAMESSCGMALFDNINQNLFLYYIEQYMLDDFIDYETGTCQFDSEEFISLLNYAATLDAAADALDEYQEVSTSLKVRRDQVLLEPVELTSIGQMHNLEAYTIGEDISWIGWPCTDASKVQAISDVAIMAASEHIDGAIEFLEYLMDAQSQENLAGSYFPMTKDAFEETIHQTETDYSTTNTELATKTTVDGTTYSIVPLSQEKADAYTAWMSTISGQTYYPWDIAAIIDEECGALFAGDKTSEETSTIIQNRVSVYLSEQK